MLALLMGVSVSAIEFPRGERRIDVSAKRESVTSAAIVVPESNPVRAFAAKELQHFLLKSAGIKAEITSEPVKGKLSLVLGDNKYARSAGLDVKKLASEGFFIKADFVKKIEA